VGTRARCGASEGPLIDLILCASGAPCLGYESISLDSDPVASAWGRGYYLGCGNGRQFASLSLFCGRSGLRTRIPQYVYKNEVHFYVKFLTDLLVLNIGG
jgi:hypothetical protein